MVKKYWLILAAILMAVIVIVIVAQTITPEYQIENTFRIGELDKMATYLNEKYGYSVTAADCVYFRKEDYSWHGDLLGYGSNYDIPNIAIFDYDGNYITVTDRNGFLGDDAQLEELNELLCGYFEERTGVEIEFVEMRAAQNGNIFDCTLNQVLHHSFNEKLTEENIGEFVDLIWNNSDLGLELIFYFEAKEDIEAQLKQITVQLNWLNRHKNLKSLRFYITDMDELNVYYKTPTVHSQDRDKNNRESNEGYIWGHYHVANEVEHHYPVSENSYYQNVEFNTFLLGGFCMLDRGYSGGFGNREVQTVNNFGVVDLSDVALAGYLEEMVSYGEYRGYTVLFRAGYDAAISSMTIADGDKYLWKFTWGSGPVELYAFKHGQLLELKTAYECGYLSPEDMDRILEAHKQYFAQHHHWDYGEE